MLKLPMIARIASAIALVLAVIDVIGSILGSIINLPAALIPLAAGLGIWRGRVWSAYGLALYFLGQILILPFLFTRPGHAEIGTALIASAVLSALLALLYFFTGRSLTALDPKRAGMLPWIALTAAFTLPLLIVRPLVIPTGSMEDTFLVGDRLLVQTVPSRAPQRDELVAFVYPIDGKSIFIKRVVGIPGDRLHIVKKTLYRNGAALTEPYAVHRSTFDDPYRDNLPSPPSQAVLAPGLDMLSMHVQNGEIIVPIGQYFVIGDNRDQSLDSRYWGFVPASDILGKPLLIYDSEAPNKGGRRWARIFKQPR